MHSLSRGAPCALRLTPYSIVMTPEKPSPKASVLLVEDDEELRFILGAHLRAAGFRVLESGDGYQGQRMAVEHRPNLIVMDIGLPGMDGVSATRALKADERTSAIPVLMLTARSNTTDLVRGLEAGAHDYLGKPFDVTEFTARIRTLHRLASAHSELDRLNARLEQEVHYKTRRLQALYEYMRDLNHAQSREQILDLLIRCAAELTRAERISLFLRDHAGEKLVCVRAVGLDPARVEPIRVTTPQGIAGQVYRRGTTLAARTYGTEHRSESPYSRPTFVSTPLISTSLETADGKIGVLNVTNKADEAQFSEEEIECIRSVADAAAIALDNMQRRARLQQSVRVLLQTLGHLAEFRDEETTQHLTRVSRMAQVLAEELQGQSQYGEQITAEFIENLVQAAPMHDIGKVGIPDEILTKRGKLTDEEYQIMKTHADIGRRVLSRAMDPNCPVPLLQMCIDIAHSHHERYDGKGYPRRLSGRQIPLAARIIALVDAYDAITSARRYKLAHSHERAVEVIRSEAGRHFDPVIVDAFLRCEQRFSALREARDPAAKVGEVASAN